jgi:hypothetical protein
LGSSFPKPVTALSDAGFLVVGADGAVDVVVDVEAAAGVVDGVVAAVEAGADVVVVVVTGAGDDILEPSFLNSNVNGFAAE